MLNIEGMTKTKTDRQADSISMWRNLNFFHNCHVCDVENVSTSHIIYAFLLQFTFLCQKFSFVTFYVVF